MTGETILIVEDDGLIALYLTELMERKGYRVIGFGFLRGDGPPDACKVPSARSHPDGHRT